MILGTGIGIGFAGSGGGGADPIALGAATWEGGLYLDVPLLGLASGEIASPITPQVGAAQLTPVNTPTIDPVGIGGRDAIFCDATATELLTGHAYAALASGADLPLTVIVRVKRDWPTGNRYPWGFGSSAGANDNRLMGGFASGASNSPLIIKDAPSETAKTVTRTGAMDYADHVIAWVIHGTTVDLYIDGVAVVTGGDIDTAAITTNRFAIGGQVTTAGVGHLGGWISHFAMVPAVLSAGQIATVTAAWQSKDGGAPGKAEGAPFGWFGDSITQGDSDAYATTQTRGGFRYDAYEHWRANRLRITSVGSRAHGIFANPQHSATGGFAISSITSQIDTDVPIYQPRGMFVMAGTNDSDNVEAGSMTLGQFRTAYDNMLAAARTRLDAYQSDGQIVVATLLPIQVGTLGEAAIGDMNGEILAAVAAADAANPTKPQIIVCDFHTAIGGVWDSNLFKDAVHPNEIGYRLLGAELIAKAGAYFASIG